MGAFLFSATLPAEQGAGIIMGQDLLKTASGHGHGIGPILAHTHPVAEAPGGDGDGIRRSPDRKGRGPQPQLLAQLGPGEGPAPDHHRR